MCISLFMTRYYTCVCLPKNKEFQNNITSTEIYTFDVILYKYNKNEWNSTQHILVQRLSNSTIRFVYVDTNEINITVY